VEFISIGQSSAAHVAMEFAQEAALGTIIGFVGGRLVVIALNKVALPQGLHAPFVATAALVIFGVSQMAHASGFLAVYLAGIIIGNRPTRAHNSVVTFLDAATWLAQIVMFVLLGLLVSPHRLLDSIGPAVIVELDLPGQLEQQLVGYPVRSKSLYFRRGLVPSWSKPTLVIRDERILTPTEADPVAPGDYIYLLAPPEKAEALDRFFVDMAPSSAPDPHLLGDFMVSGGHTLGEIAEIYGVKVDD